MVTEIERRLTSHSILVIEDEKEIRETLRQMLELEGYSAYEAANGREGLDLLTKIERPCLILLDLMMPIMNGWQFLEIKSGNVIFATIPVVIVSAFGDRARSFKVQGFINKPIDIDVLYGTIKQYC